MGIEFMLLQPAIHKIIKQAFPSVVIESHVELALKIQLLIAEHITEPDFDDLRCYLQSAEPSKSIDNSKLTSLCDHLASQFVTYSLYTPFLKSEWEKNIKTHWQKKVWEKVFNENSYSSNPYQVLNQKVQNFEEAPKLFFYNISFMPKPYFELLYHIGSKLQIKFFQLSPCSLFWSDIQNDFERSLFVKRMKKKHKDERQIDQLEQYLSQTNPLLANWGRLGRQWIQGIEEKEALSCEKYIVPFEATKLDAYSSWIDPSEMIMDESPISLLQGVQTDILLMRSEEKKLALSDIQSIQVHQASTYEREVEILHQNLIGLLTKDRSLRPSEIVVYVANIENYIPHIENVFSRGHSKLEAIIHDYSFSLKNSALNGIFLLIELGTTKWDQKKLLEIFYHRAFKNRFNLSSDLLKKWKEWMDEVGPCWGYNRDEQNNFLQSRYHQKISGSKFVIPSWKDFIDQLLKYLCQHHEEVSLQPKLSSIDFSSSDELNLFIEILQSLKKDLTFLTANRFSFSDWSKHLNILIEKYFSFDKEDQKDAQKIADHIRLFQSCHVKFDKHSFEFETFYYYLKKELLDFQSKASNLQLESVSFYSLFNSSPISSKVSYILGLNDMVFPRLSTENPLSLMAKFSQKEFCPAIMDYDRYLFLEILLSTKKQFFISYLGYCVETFKQVQPSVLITELLNYCDKFFTVDGCNISEKIVVKHPHLSFSKEYFNEKNYQASNYLLAKSYYGKSKATQRDFTDLFLKNGSISSAASPSNEISIQELCMSAKNPIQLSLKKQHQIFLETASINHENQNFELLPLQKAILKRKIFTKHFLSNEDELPKGIFRKLTQNALNEEVKGIEDLLGEYQLTGDDFFRVEFRQDIKEPICHEKNLWVVPSLKISLNQHLTINLVGVLDSVSSKGLLCMGHSNMESMLGDFPKYLIYSLLKNILPMEFESNWFFAKSKKVKTLFIERPEEMLKSYLSLYFLCLDQPVPLLPAWIPSFIEASPASISDKIGKDITSSHFYNQYAKVIMSKIQLKDSMLNTWKSLAQNLFHHTYEFLKNESV